MCGVIFRPDWVMGCISSTSTVIVVEESTGPSSIRLSVKLFTVKVVSPLVRKISSRKKTVLFVYILLC